MFIHSVADLRRSSYALISSYISCDNVIIKLIFAILPYVAIRVNLFAGAGINPIR